MIDPGKESRVGCLVLTGFAVTAIGIVATVVLLLAGGTYAASPWSGGSGAMLSYSLLGFLVLGIGVILTAVGLLQGGFHVFVRRNSGVVRKVEQCLVVARFAVNETGESVFDPTLADDHLKFYVRLAFPDGKRGEFRCVPEVFFAAGEGMRGTASFQGDWLGQFVPYIGTGVPPPADPFVVDRDR